MRFLAFAGMTNGCGWCHPSPLDSRFRENDESVVRITMLSWQSRMPAAAGTPGYENEAWSLEVFGCGWCHPSPLDSGLRRNDDWGVGLTKGCREWRMRGCRSGLSRIGVRDILS